MMIKRKRRRNASGGVMPPLNYLKLSVRREGFLFTGYLMSDLGRVLWYTVFDHERL